jgi:hypothetical protein
MLAKAAFVLASPEAQTHETNMLVRGTIENKYLTWGQALGQEQL